MIYITMPPSLIEKTAKWNFEKSVLKMQSKVIVWKKATIDMVRELYIAHNALAKRGCDQKREGADRYTWAAYCDGVGISPKTALALVKRFLPAEMAPDGADKLLEVSELHLVQTGDKNCFEARLALVSASGARPDDWTDAEEREYRSRLKRKQLEETAEKLRSEKINLQPREDYFSQAMKGYKKQGKVVLDGQEQLRRQSRMFDTISDYVRSFDSMGVRLSAAINLSTKLRDIVNETCELELQMQEAASAEQEEEE